METRRLFFWLFISAIMIVLLRLGVLESASQYFYNLRNIHLPSFDYRYDDFLPYFPLAVLFILKLSGVKSRSNWKKMFVSLLFSFALMGLVVCTIKSVAGVLRPDSSDFLSFPSGHTATVFTSACILYKEYKHLSKWISVVAFFPAVVTGASRILNNRHWLSDVSAGAIIGIMSVETAYYFTDRLFRRKNR
ncbi:phosphatase PAP2 family protein [Oscillospiraceae bacterium N12]|jgi:membrane-associated phospholipid phosphatase|uniref:Phosphatase PAP2 family protein n=1 Tax=Jilunia laotingensis TaxID=2763675 RepID=A0A926F6Z8_9BACT|nr:phosphatase PAP2 family protein [Jilunia laotingensis]MBC8594501.1 phosphatase PAP2 family protein [Jilunia laotingensis]